jgi:hypothetical protein
MGSGHVRAVLDKTMGSGYVRAVIDRSMGSGYVRAVLDKTMGSSEHVDSCRTVGNYGVLKFGTLRKRQRDIRYIKCFQANTMHVFTITIT